jgi:integrase
MISTFNGCYHSPIKVIPKNWHTTKASVKTPWRGYYNFHDPAWKHIKKYKYGKQVKILGMNRHMTLEERQAITRKLILDEEHQLQALGFNPITKCYMAQVASILDEAPNEITIETPFILALTRAFIYCISSEVISLMSSDAYKFKNEGGVDLVYKEESKLIDESGTPLPIIDVVRLYMKEKGLSFEIEPETIEDIKSTLKYFAQSAEMLNKHQVPLKDIKITDLLAILSNCRNLTVKYLVNKKVFQDGKWKTVKELKNGKRAPVKIEVSKPKIWNENQFNHYRKYLHILYAKLKKLNVKEYNPIDNIDIKNIPIDPDKKRKVLTPEQGKLVDAYLKIKFPEFHRLCHIFYHGGTRRKEIMKLKGEQVDLDNQRFKILIKKRKQDTWVWKTIKDKALPYWREAMAYCKPTDYVFSVGLVPGSRFIRPEQITRRWEEHVKKALGIDVDFYAFKYLRTTNDRTELELLYKKIDAMAIKEVAETNSHTTGAMVVNIYDVENDNRNHNRVKGLQNSFTG